MAGGSSITGSVAPGADSPFIRSVSFEAEESNRPAPAIPDSAGANSPFLRVYETTGQFEGADPEAEAYAELLAELHDEEFAEAIGESIEEAAELVEDRLTSEVGDPVARVRAAEQMLEAHFAPWSMEIEGFLEKLGGEAERHDLNAMSESEFEGLLQQYGPEREMSPAFDHLFGSIKKAFKKVKKFAKKASKVASKFGLGFVFRKLRRIVKPLLRRVLKAAINKLPARYRPLASKVAKGLGRRLEKAEVEPDAVADEAFYNAAEIQREFNEQVAEILFADESAQEELVIAEYGGSGNEPVLNTLAELDQARLRFAREVLELEDGQDATPAVENFVPAILPALKLGIRLAGRKRVVNFIAKLVARLIQRVVGRTHARPLSRAIVDAGLRLINLEATAEDEALASGDAVAATVEDTVRRVTAAPDAVLDDEALLEGLVIEAFEQAARENLPNRLLTEEAYEARPDLRETAEARGMWLRLPLRGSKRYKKYTGVFNVSISPYTARTLSTFGGKPLAGFLNDQLALPGGRSVQARVHLYEVMPGSLPGLIARHERGVAGMNVPAAVAAMQLHPLTPEAAGMLLQEPGLGRVVPQAHLRSPRMLAVGQRLYFLDVAGARLQAMPAVGAPAFRRSSDLRLTLHFPEDQIQALLFLSEGDAQLVASKLRQRAPAGVLMRVVGPLLGDALAAALVRGSGAGLTLIHESAAAQPSVARILSWMPPIILEQWHTALTGWIMSALTEHFRTCEREVIAATEEPADGVTLLVTLMNPPGFAALRRAFRGTPGDVRSFRIPAGVPQVTSRTISGYHRE